MPHNVLPSQNYPQCKIYEYMTIWDYNMSLDILFCMFFKYLKKYNTTFWLSYYIDFDQSQNNLWDNTIIQKIGILSVEISFVFDIT